MRFRLNGHDWSVTKVTKDEREGLIADCDELKATVVADDFKALLSGIEEFLKATTTEPA